jgi:hypothetical protein
MMLGNPETVVAESFGVAREIGGIAERLRRGSSLNDRGEIENGEWNRRESVTSGLGHLEE